ncbi:MAG: class II aldolase/adducin family protein [Bacteroidales bacterium]|nr:class II aldolase/adducin family protein [Bacteroidales bacterium]
MPHLVCQREVAYYMRRMYRQRLTTSLGGNISLLVEPFLYITPSQTDKASLLAKHVCAYHTEDKNLSLGHSLSMELGMHLAIYSQQTKAKAVIHAHPPYATAFTVAHQLIDTRLTTEAWELIGQIIAVPYAAPGTDKLAQWVADASLKASVILLENHGILAWGATLSEAFRRIELIEHTACIQLASNLLGKTHRIPDQI